ncbi:MAG: hypothetical protein AAF939_00110 [Planctomycetota bacterium]
MNLYCKCKTFVAMMIVGLMTTIPLAKVHAQAAPEPVAIISVANIKKQQADVKYILEAAGFGQLNFMVKTFLKGYTNGIDDKQPAGVMVYFDEDSVPGFLGFAPVEDMEEVLDVLATAAQIDEGDDSTAVIFDDGTEVIMKESNGFAFFSNVEKTLDSLPDTPVDMLGDLPSRFNLSAQVFAQRIPPSMRDQVIQTIKDSAQMTLDNMEENAINELQRKNLENQMAQLEEAMNETDSIMFGMSVDPKGKRLLAEVEFTAMEGTKLAKNIAASKSEQPSRFTGFLMDGAFMTANQCTRLGEDEAKSYTDMLDSFQASALEELKEEDLSDAELDTVENAISSMMDVMKETMAEGVVDSGAVIMLNEGEVNFAAGLQVANPKKLEDTVKELSQLAEEKMGGELEINLNSGSHKDVTFHQFTVQIPDDEEEMRNAIGDQLELIVGVGKKEIYLGGGSNPLPLIKKAMDSTEMAKEMVQYNFYIAPLLDFAAKQEGDPTVDAMAKAIKESGNDRISITSDLIDNGIRMEFELQDGILGLINVGYQAMQGGFNDDF